MKTANFAKLALLLPIIGYSFSSHAEITIDGQNASYPISADSNFTINGDGSVMVNGTLAAKCEADTKAKVIKTKTATISCDPDFISVKDKNGNSFERFSSYAKSTDKAGNVERKQFDESWAKIGSATTGASAYSEKTATTFETKSVTTTETTTPVVAPTTVVPQVDQKLYTPKLGTEAQKTPSITKHNTIRDAKADKAVAKAEKKVKAQAAAPKAAPVTETIIKSTETAPETTKTVTTTGTVLQPTPSAAAAGITPETKINMQQEIVPTELAPKNDDEIIIQSAPAQ